MTPLTKVDLDRMACSTPGCDHTAHDGLYLTQRCHPLAKVTARYKDGVIFIACGFCMKTIADIAVKDDHVRPH